MSAAAIEVRGPAQPTTELGGSFLTLGSVIYTDSPRAAYTAKLRELADRIDSGELSGARAEWNDAPGQPAMVYAEVDTVREGEPASVRFVRVTFATAASRLRVCGEEKLGEG